jgi:hypothetical protein
MELLKGLKLGGKERAKWLRGQVRLERRRRQEHMNNSNGTAANEPEPEEEEEPVGEETMPNNGIGTPSLTNGSRVTAYEAQGSSSDSTCTFPAIVDAGASTSRDISHAPVVSASDGDFLAADNNTSSTTNGGSDKKSQETPICTLPECQPIFEAYLRYLIDEKRTPAEKAIKRSQKAMAELFGRSVEPVTYEQLREVMVSRLRNNDEQAQSGGDTTTAVADPDTAASLLDQFLEARGVARLNCRQEIVRLTVDHFFRELRLGPVIRKHIITPTITAAAVGGMRSEAIRRSLERKDIDEHNHKSESPGNEGGKEPDWFEELLLDVTAEGCGAAATLRTASFTSAANWSEPKGCVVPSPQKKPSAESHLVEGFDGLERHYDWMIRQQPDRRLRAAYRARGITGLVLGNCWRLVPACATFERLSSVYRLQADRPPAELEQQLRQLLEQNDQVKLNFFQ